MDLNKELNFVWEYCPEEILEIIFKYLDFDDLANCFKVSRHWRCNVNEIAKRRNIWPELFKQLMHNQGVTYESKSSLQYFDMYLNSILWSSVHLANVELIETFNYIGKLKTIKVYKEILYVIADYVLQISLETSYVKKLDSIEKRYIDYDESDFFTIKVSLQPTPCGNDMNELYLLNKKTNTETCTLFHFFRLQQDKCYIIEHKNIIRFYNGARDLDERFNVLVRYYGPNGSICAMNVFCDSCYILTTSGMVYYCDKDNMMLIHTATLKLGYTICIGTVIQMFDKFSVVIGVNKEKDFKVKPIENSEQMVIECPGLTSAISHGNILFLGYYDGKVEICLPRKLLQDLPYAIRAIKPSEYKQSDNIEAVRAIDVYECLNTHHLFIGTEAKVYRLKISHPMLYD